MKNQKGCYGASELFAAIEVHGAPRETNELIAYSETTNVFSIFLAEALGTSEMNA